MKLESLTSALGRTLQRKCTCDRRGLDSGEQIERRKRYYELPSRATDNSEVSAVPPIVHEVVRSPGQPLDNETREFMEPRFGHDFSRVHVHTDAKAAQSTKAVNALAYTVGTEVVFGAGYHVPKTPAGAQLLAHELTHVVQQSGAAPEATTPTMMQSPPDSAEREAERVAHSLGEYGATGVVHRPIGLRLQRTPDTGPSGDPLHAPITEGFRERQGLPPRGVDERGERVGPSDAQIKYQLNPAAQIGRFSAMTPWALSLVPPGRFALAQRELSPAAQRQIGDLERAGALVRHVFGQLNVTFDVDRSSGLLGREPNAAELRGLNRMLGRILSVSNVRPSLEQSGAREVPTVAGSTSPSLGGKVRIARNPTEFGIKRYLLEMLIAGLAGQDATELDRGVRELWQSAGINPASSASITNQERQAVLLFIKVHDQGNPGFYLPSEDTIYLEPGINLRAPGGAGVATHETVHLLGGREQTRQAFVARYGSPGFIHYWSPFEEGMTETIAREATPQSRRVQPTSSTTTTHDGATTTTTVGPGYGQEVQLIAAIITDLGRATVFNAYFTGQIPTELFQQLERRLPNP